MHNTRFMIIAATVFLLLACNIPSLGGLGQQNDTSMGGTVQAQQATIDALQKKPTEVPPTIEPPSEVPTEAEPEPTSPPPEEEATEAPTQAAPTTKETLSTDFTSNVGFFTLQDKMEIKDGGLFMGKFECCADFTIELNQPAGCLAVCQACGEVSDYDVSFDLSYVEGLVDKQFGFALRFDDKNGNNMIDRDDYFLGFIFSYYAGDSWVLVEHRPKDAAASWYNLRGGSPHLRGKSTMPLRIHITSFNGGKRMMLWMEDELMFKIQSEDPEKVERIFYINMPDKGKIGFWVANNNIKLKYGNFNFSSKVEEPSDW